MTAAGRSQRFVDAGYLTPKPALEINWRGTIAHMVSHVVTQIPSEYVAVVTTGAVRLPITWYDVHSIEKTFGPAETTLLGLRRIQHDGPVVVMDCDTIVLRKDLERLVKALEVSAAAVLVYESDDKNMSRIDEYPYPTVFVEKKRISPWGVVSARGFSSAATLRSCLTQVLEEALTIGREPTMSHVLNRYPGVKRAIEIAEWIDWGTPARVIKSGARIVG